MGCNEKDWKVKDSRQIPHSPLHPKRLYLPFPANCGRRERQRQAANWLNWFGGTILPPREEAQTGLSRKPGLTQEADPAGTTSPSRTSPAWTHGTRPRSVLLRFGGLGSYRNAARCHGKNFHLKPPLVMIVLGPSLLKKKHQWAVKPKRSFLLPATRLLSSLEGRRARC